MSIDAPRDAGPPRERPDETASGRADDPDPTVVHPTIRPLVIKSALLILVWLAILAYLLRSPMALGSPDMTEVGVLVLSAVSVIGVTRYFVRMVILRCTRYGVADRTVWRDFELVRRRKRREVPYERLRSCEISQGRIEALLGFGTIALNQGLGTLRLEHVEDPDGLYRTITGRMNDD